jgi:hypothetical protein
MRRKGTHTLKANMRQVSSFMEVGATMSIEFLIDLTSVE